MAAACRLRQPEFDCTVASDPQDIRIYIASFLAGMDMYVFQGIYLCGPLVLLWATYVGNVAALLPT